MVDQHHVSPGFPPERHQGFEPVRHASIVVAVLEPDQPKERVHDHEHGLERLDRAPERPEPVPRGRLDVDVYLVIVARPELRKMPPHEVAPFFEPQVEHRAAVALAPEPR